MAQFTRFFLAAAAIGLALAFTLDAAAQTPDASLTVAVPPATPEPSAVGVSFSFTLGIANTGTAPLDAGVVIDTVPEQLEIQSVTTGAYSGLTEFAPGEGVRVSYEKNTAPTVFTLWNSSPGAATNTTLIAPPPGLGAGEYITRIRWEYGQFTPGATAITPPRITGQVINPSNTGGFVSIGSLINNCAAFSAVYTAGPTSVIRNHCKSFTLGSPYNPPTVPGLDGAALALFALLLGAGGMLIVWRRLA